MDGGMTSLESVSFLSSIYLLELSQAYVNQPKALVTSKAHYFLTQLSFSDYEGKGLYKREC
jgi:hypothetical protein